MWNWKSGGLFHNVANGSRMPPDLTQLQINAKDGLLGRLAVYRTCEAHKKTINSMVWNESGELLLSGASDGYITITNPLKKQFNRFKTPHPSKIMCARFMPCEDNLVVTSSCHDGLMCFDLKDAVRNKIKTPILRVLTYEETKQIVTVPTQPKVFITCHTDTTVRLFDLRTRYNTELQDCVDNILIRLKYIPTAMSISPISHNYIAIGDNESSVKVFDRRYLTSEPVTSPVKVYYKPGLDISNYVTSLAYDEHEEHILVNFASEDLYLFDVAKDDGTTQYPTVRPESRSEAENNAFWRTARNENVSEEDWHRLSQQVMNFAQNLRLQEMEEEEDEVDQVEGWDTQQEDDDDSVINEGSITDSSAAEEPTDSDSDDEGYMNFSMLVVKSDDSDDDPDAGPSEIQPNIRFVKNLKHVAQGYKTLHKYRTCLTEVGYWGKNYVFAGSDCGNVLLWDKHKPDCIMMLNGNHMLVNSVQAHPTLPILAAGGGLGLLKLFMPTSEYSLFDDETIPEVKRKMAKQACYRRRLSSPIYVVYGLDG